MKYKYKIRYDSYRLPIATKEYTLAQIEDFLQDQYDRDDWEDKAGERPCRDRRIILYAVCVARAAPKNDRKDQLIQLCRKHTAAQPLFWPRFLRERYQYAKTRDFFSVDYNDIIWEYHAYDDEHRALEADPSATGRVFDGKPQLEKFLRDFDRLTKQMIVKQTTMKGKTK